MVVTFSVSATDNCGLTNLVVTPGTGSAFPVGTNLVRALAQDASGNSNTCSFTVTVLAEQFRAGFSLLRSLGGLPGNDGDIADL